MEATTAARLATIAQLSYETHFFGSADFSAPDPANGLSYFFDGGLGPSMGFSGFELIDSNKLTPYDGTGTDELRPFVLGAKYDTTDFPVADRSNPDNPVKVNGFYNRNNTQAFAAYNAATGEVIIGIRGTESPDTLIDLLDGGITQGEYVRDLKPFTDAVLRYANAKATLTVR